jgi:small GTP-binding protein
MTTFKVVMIGDSGVGKTALVDQYLSSSFTDSGLATVGIDFHAATVVLDGEPVHLQLWDTAGQEKYRAITTQYMRGAGGVILVFAVSQRDSFDHIGVWKDLVDQMIGSRVSMILVGNKSDLRERGVSEEEGLAVAQGYDLEYFETSAKTGQNVKVIFEELARMMAVHKSMDSFGETNPVALEDPVPAPANACC